MEISSTHQATLDVNKTGEDRMDVTGQIITRHTGESLNGKKLLVVVGIIAVPEDTHLEDDHQYTVAGTDQLLTILPDGVDRVKECRGQTASGILTSPIWRV